MELTHTAWDIQPFARECGFNGGPFRWDEERRFLLRCELDSAYFHLYAIAHDDVDYIMDTFPIVRRKDEAAYGEYRTKRVILEMYDEMAEAMCNGQPYRTHLDPPPADPRVAHPPREVGEAEESGGTFGLAESRPRLPPDVTAPAPAFPAKAAGARRPSGGQAKARQAAPSDPGPPAAATLFPELKAAPAAPASKVQAQGPAQPSTAPPLLIPVVAAPQGSYPQRLTEVMALRKERTPQAIGALIAALADPESNIRWLASSTLAGIGGEAVVAAIGAYIDQAPSAVAREEAEHLLDRLIGA